MDISGSPSLERFLSQVAEQYPEHDFILNMEKVRTINSAGVGVMIHFLDRMKRRQSRFIVSNLNFFAKKVMDFLDMETILDIYDIEEDAINSLSVKI